MNATGIGPSSDASTSVAPAAPTLTAEDVEDDTATLTIGKFTPDWYYKYTTPTGGSCSTNAVTVTEEDLTGLDANTDYTYKAYSDSGCATEQASESFLTKPGKPTKPSAASGAGSGKLRLTSSVTGSGTILKWQYQQKASSDSNFGSWQNISNSGATSLNHVVSGLTDGTSYQFKVRAVNATGNSATSDASDAAQPANETLTASSVTHNSATITIGNHAGDWYHKRTAPTTPTASCSSVVSSGTYTASLSDLSGNTDYTWKAYSDSGCSTELASESFLTKPAKPAKPTVTTNVGSGKLALSSSVTGGSGALDKWQYSTDSGTNWSDAQVTSTTLSHVVTGLTDGTSYTFKVRAVNSTGTGPASEASDGLEPAATGLAVSKVGSTTATLTLSNYGNNNNWYYNYSSGTCKGPVSTATKDLTGLSGNTSYTYKAYSDNSCGTQLAAAPAFLTKPGKPTKPTATAGAGSAKLTLSSLVTGSGTISKWQYQQKASSDSNFGSWQNISNSRATSLSHVVSGLMDGTSYTFKVRAVNSTGTGPASDASDAATPTSSNPNVLLTPTLKASAITETTARLSLENSSQDWSYQANAAPYTDCSQNTVPAGTTVSLTGLSLGTSYTFTAYSDNCLTEIASVSFRTLIPNRNRPPAFPENAATDQSAMEDELFTYTVQAARDPDGDDLTYSAMLVGGGNLPGWLSFDGTTRTFSGTPLESDTPATHQVQVTASDGDASDTVTFIVTAVEVNDPPEFTEAAADQTATEDQPFRYQGPIATDPDHEEASLVYTAFVEQSDGKLVSPQQPDWPGWLTFDGTTRTFRGTPGREDAPRKSTLLLRVEDPEGLSDTTRFTLTVETLYNSRLPHVARQWLARFGRTVSSQVVESITGRLANDDAGDTVVLNGQPLTLSGAVAEPRDSSAASGANGTNGINGADAGVSDPLARLLPNSKEQLEEKSVSMSPSTRELLTGSSFRLSLNPDRTQFATTAGGDLESGGKGVKSALGAGDWTVWGEAALTNFDGTDGDLSLSGEVLTGVAAVDWQRDRWLLGIAAAHSVGDGSFSAPQTEVDDAVKGTVRSSLTAAYPYVRYWPSPGMAVWGVAGYGRGSMTLDADGEDAANPDIWLTMVGVGGRSSLLSAEQTGGLELDLTTDGLFTRIGAEADVPLRDAVEAFVSRLRLGLESSWRRETAGGITLTPTLSTALRYDAGDAENGFGVELGAGVAYSNPNRGLSFSLDIRGLRGLLSRQEGEGVMGFREWGGSGSIRYDHGGDGLGLTVAVSPSWGVADSRADQFWSEAAPPFTTVAKSASGSSDGTVRLDSEIGYGVVAFNGNAVITPYGGLSLSDGSRDWRLGSRFSFLPGLDISIAGTRRESAAEPPDHGVQLDLTTTW